jgi:hypothetical protein
LTYPQRLLHSFRDLSELVPSQETVRSTLDFISALAVRTISDCDVASVSLVKVGGISTVGSSGDVAVALDAIQYSTGQGPCLDAIGKDAMWFQIDDMARDEKWPTFSALAVEQGFSSLLAFTLRVDADTLGALNLYARKPNAFGQEDRDYGAIYAAHAAVSLAHAQTRAEGVRARRAMTEELVSQEVIGRAVGILMEGEFRSAQDALEVLEARAEALKVKLQETAQEVVDSAEERRTELPLPDGFDERVITRVQEGRRGAKLRTPPPLVLAAILAAGSLTLAAAAGAHFRDDGRPAARGEARGAEAGGGIVLVLDGKVGEARLFASPAGSTLVADGLAPLGRDSTYQVWLFRTGDVVATRVFAVENGSASVDVSYPAMGTDRVVVTIEPAGGSVAPTTDPVLESA